MGLSSPPMSSCYHWEGVKLCWEFNGSVPWMIFCSTVVNGQCPFPTREKPCC